MARTRQRKSIEDAATIGLLASPTRIEIIDTLEALGGAVTVAELAHHLGRPADGLYYHLRPLVAGGLVEECSAPDARRYRTRAGVRLELRYRPGANANARAVERVADSVLRVARRDFARALADPATVATGARRELWAARAKGWVDGTELAEINRLLGRLMDLLQRPRRSPGDRLVALAWVLAPLDEKPARRAKPPRKRPA